MAQSTWHRVYRVEIAAPADEIFERLVDLPSYGTWLTNSDSYGSTTSVEPYPVQVGSRYHDGKPDDSGRSWWGTVTGLQRPGSIDFHHTIAVKELRATVDVHIHYSVEPAGNAATTVERWLVLDFRMPVVLRPLRRAIVSSFDKENLRTLAALKQSCETT